MSDPYRILVTGSRDWDDYLAVENAIHDAYFAACSDMSLRMIVVHGAAKGADEMAGHVAAGMAETGFPVVTEPHPADWAKWGTAAGPRRNEDMVLLGASLCLAFIKDGSRGASHCARLARKAGIPVRRFTPDA